MTISIRSLAVWLLASCSLFLSSISFAQTVGPQNLRASLRAVDNGVEFVLTNDGTTAQSVLVWETPLEPELSQDVFGIVVNDGGNPSVFTKRAVYSGRSFKRPDPGPEDFIRIEAGESVRSVVALSDYYLVEAGGLHTVRFGGLLHVKEGQRDRTTYSIHSDDLHEVYTASESVQVELQPKPVASYARVAGYNSCSAERQSELVGDYDASEVITRDAYTALNELPENERPGSPRYLHWFGDYTPGRYDKVLNTYLKAEELMGQEAVEFVCDCDDEPYYAYIIRIEPFKVHLCYYYWLAPRLGTDSRAGTILHEVSHFNEVAGTEDNAYGTGPVASLARSNPAAAVDNADSIEYFAENTPFREISAGPTDGPLAPEYATLQVGQPQTGSVAAGNRVLYQVIGADYVELTSNSGDADLYVYADDFQDQQICQSRLEAATDRCELPASSMAYIVVEGYTQADYSIVAGSNGSTGTTPEVVTQSASTLTAGQSRINTVGTGERQYYTVTGASVVEITSLSGDADVYVFSDESRQADTLICSSRNTSTSSTVDVCELADGDNYVMVYGVTAGEYQILASTRVTTETGSENVGGTITVGSDSLSGGAGGGQLSLWFVVLLLVPVCKRLKSVNGGAGVAAR